MSNISSSHVVFLLYAHEDESYKNTLLKWLTPMRRKGFFTDWHDRDIVPGQRWEAEIAKWIEASDIILLLVSIDFLSSDYINSKELKRAIELQKEKRSLVIPILLRPCPWWNDHSLRRLQVLPKGAKPISTWKDKDEAYLSIIEGIARAIRELEYHPEKFPA